MTADLRIGSLFSGIGGLERGLEAAALGRVVWQCEIDPFCRRVLAAHWPDVSCYDDVRALPGDLPVVDILCGGFPCQDISIAGKQAGLSGARSGLFFAIPAVADACKASVLILENVRQLLALDTMYVVVSTLHDAGWPIVRWGIVSAASQGAPHRRERVFVVATRGDGAAMLADAATGLRRTLSTWIGGGDPEPWEMGIPRLTDIRSGRRVRIRSLGNAVVPRVAEHVAHCACAADHRGDMFGWPLADETGFPPCGVSERGTVYPTQAWAPVVQTGESVASYYARKAAGLDLAPTNLAVRQWPTLTANDVQNAGYRMSGKTVCVTLSGATGSARQWPTLTQQDANGESPESWGGSASLQDAVRQWPTLRASEWKGVVPLGSSSEAHREAHGYLDATVQMPEGRSGKLNPDWCEPFMGFPPGWTVTEGFARRVARKRARRASEQQESE